MLAIKSLWEVLYFRGILNARLFDQLPKNACIINAARGEHFVENDLLNALESGQLSQATLDVFHTDPLPKEHPLWGHPNILIRPHLAFLIDLISGGDSIAKSILNIETDNYTDNMTHIDKGY